MGAVGGVLSLGHVSRAQTPGSKRMNLLLLLAEDMGHQLGCYGDEHARTPNLDRLASQGVRFHNAYVTTASCSPSRASILTGLYPQQHGQIGLSVSYSERRKLVSMKPGITTLPQLLTRSGYRTGVLGKIHVDAQEDIGFDFMRGSDSLGVSEQSPAELPIVRDNGKKAVSHVRYSADVDQMTRDAKDFLADAKDAPFFLMVNFSDAHLPYYNQVNGYPATMHQPEEFTKPFPFSGEDSLDPATQRQMAAYYNCIARLDASVGQILDALEKSGNAKQTLVIFLSDHGPGGFSKGTAKLTNREAGLKVPFLLRCPGQDVPGTFAGFVSSLDIMPTALDAAGVAPLSSLPGQSLLEVLAGKAQPHEEIYGEFNRHLDNRIWPIRSVRSGRYKLIYYAFADVYRPVANTDAQAGRSTGLRSEYIAYGQMPEYEFFDLAKDPHELNSLAGDTQYEHAFQGCLGKLRQWQEMVGDFLLDPPAAEKERNLARQNIRKVFGDLPQG
ncbi:MAG: sulfatase [Sedimentisphaerales bacterium]|nr:sulfatase [Sedimentisphaerales bacterium]